MIKGRGIKILPLKQTLQRLSIELAQVKAGNTFESFMNEIQQIIYSQNKFRKRYTIVNSKHSLSQIPIGMGWCLISQIKWTYEEVITMLHCQILVSNTYR